MSNSIAPLNAFLGSVHLVFSTHWDREWYLPFQKFRAKLITVLDQVLDELESGRLEFYQMDGQFIPVEDYLEIRPEKEALLRGLIEAGRFRVGPWYNLPDEFLVSGESIVRNLLLGMKCSETFGQTSKIGWLCDTFGHNSQMPQVLAQLGIENAFVWRGVDWNKAPNPFYWQGSDGTKVLTHRFNQNGYADFPIDVRRVFFPDEEPTVDQMVENALAHLEKTKADGNGQELLWFDGGDHTEFDPAVIEMMQKLNELAGREMVKVSTLDRFMAALRDNVSEAPTVQGELRDPAKMETYGSLISGVGSSRIPLKQANHAGETLLTLWAEPWCAAASFLLGLEYPAASFDLAWKYLLKNHPHDSICGCSPDETHASMTFRFDQSRHIAECYLDGALKALGKAELQGCLANGDIGLSVFTPAGGAVHQRPEVFVRLPKDWPQFVELFGFESKPSLRIFDISGNQVEYQLLEVVPSTAHLRTPLNHFPAVEERQGVRLALDIAIPPAVAQHFVIKRSEGPTRIAQNLLIGVGRNTLRNEALEITAANDGTISLTDLASGHTYSGLLAMEDTADNGDGWWHGVSLQDRAILSTGGMVAFGITENGPLVGRLHMRVEWPVPEEFDFHKNARSRRLKPLVVEHLVTMRKGSTHVEIETTIDNSMLDHRLRLLCPTGLRGADCFWADTPFDAVERPIKLRNDNYLRRELQVEMTPQQNWVATTDGQHGLALIAPGQYESAALDQPDRPLCLTLLRAFRKAVFTDGNEGGQIQGVHKIRMALKPFTGEVPSTDLFQTAQALAAPARSIYSESRDFRQPSGVMAEKWEDRPRIEGPVVFSACYPAEKNTWVFRVFNPGNATVRVRLVGGKSWQITGLRGDNPKDVEDAGACEITPKQIVSMRVAF